MTMNIKEVSGLIRWCEYVPGDGYRYVLYTSELPVDAEGGNRESHVLVTLYQPFRAAHIFSKDGTLSFDYVWEKLFQPYAGAQPDPDTTWWSWCLHVAGLIGKVLGRQVILPEEVGT